MSQKVRTQRFVYFKARVAEQSQKTARKVYKISSKMRSVSAVNADDQCFC